MNISLIAFDDFTDIDIYFLWDLLNRIEYPEWKVKILGTKAHHISMTGLRLETHGHISEANKSDAVLFGSGMGTRKLMNDTYYLNVFKLDPSLQLIGSMCSGALLLGGLGLIKGLEVTTYPTASGLLEQFGATYIEKPIVVNGNIATAAGCLAAVELSAWVSNRLTSPETTETMLSSVLPNGKGLESLQLTVLEEVSINGL
jgi:transcriptional regulator GlxA family with amidase domain